jgi:Fe2+ or Zn2+ uptake regulation protein
MIPVPLAHAVLRKAFEAGGFRCTPQRLAIYDHLSQADCHPTAEEIFHAVRPSIPKISLATVYKALEALVAIGVVSRLPSPDDSGSARYDARSEEHYHFRCLRTGVVHDLPTRFDPALIAKLDPELTSQLERNGFHVTGYRLELIGYQNPGASPFARSPEDEPRSDVLVPGPASKSSGTRS